MIEQALPVSLLTATDNRPSHDVHKHHRSLTVNHRVTIDRRIRQMRGDSQSQLVRAVDGLHYVVKFRDNPQGNRSLANEWICGTILQQLGVSTPSLHFLTLGANRRQDLGDLGLTPENSSLPFEAGVHLASLCPVDPGVSSIYDFLPRTLFDRICNLVDFALVCAVDKLLGLVGYRQVIFQRKSDTGSSGPCYQALFIDHGKSLGGSAWKISTSVSDGFYWDKRIYANLCAQHWDHAIERVQALPDSVYAKAAAQIPEEWCGTADRQLLLRLLNQAFDRQGSVRSLVTDLRLSNLL